MASLPFFDFARIAAIGQPQKNASNAPKTRSRMVDNTGVKHASGELLGSSTEIGFGFSKKTAHPRALLLLKEDFYWSCVDDNSPFGNDAGGDALQSFAAWRKINPRGDVVSFVETLSERFQAPLSKWKNITSLDVKSARSFELMYIFQTCDQMLIAVALGQLLIEGTVDVTLKGLAKKAIDNEFGIADQWLDVDERKKRLQTMMIVLNKV